MGQESRPDAVPAVALVRQICGVQYPTSLAYTPWAPHIGRGHITHQMWSTTFDAGNLHVRFDERGVETGLWHGYLGTVRRKGRQQTSQSYCYRATSRLYQVPGESSEIGALPATDRDVVRRSACFERSERKIAHLNRVVDQFIVVRRVIAAEAGGRSFAPGQRRGHAPGATGFTFRRDDLDLASAVRAALRSEKPGSCLVSRPEAGSAARWGQDLRACTAFRTGARAGRAG